MRQPCSAIRVALQFPTYGTGVSYVWHYSFLPMKLEFSTYETGVFYL